MIPRLKEKFYTKIQVDLAKKLSLKNKMMLPRFDKIVINRENTTNPNVKEKLKKDEEKKR